jgi:hypothetical protein
MLFDQKYVSLVYRYETRQDPATETEDKTLKMRY